MTVFKEKLVSDGYEGFLTVKYLKQNFSAAGVPKTSGVYLILRLKDTAPQFLTVGSGGYFKGQEPNVGIEELRLNWVDNEPVVYIGKANNLNGRLRQYMQFGCGKNIGHRGGRYIWQLADSDELVVCWKRIENPREVEHAMITDFKNSHSGQRPFANLVD